MSARWYTKKWVIVLLHIAAWVFLFSLPYLLRPTLDQGRPPKSATSSSTADLRYVINSLMYIGIFYLNAYLLVPLFIYKRKYWQYPAIIIALFIFLLFFSWLVFFHWLNQGEFNLRGHILFNFFLFLFMLAASTAFQMIRDRTQSDRREREKENENLKTELSLLRSQASPHFMFNVLNNMVSLARKKSDLLEPSLLKFSSLMRYMLYEADEEKVSLEKEIEYLQSYIDLQQQRFGKNLELNVTFQGINNQLEIEPMLLIPFVENAFKHGTGMIDGAKINIELRNQRNDLTFIVQNKYVAGTTEIKDKISGIGLANVKRRLNLLYGKRQQLTITQKDGWFTVSLELKLK